MAGFVKVSNEVNECLSQLDGGAVILYMAILYKKRNRPLKLSNSQLSEICGGIGKNKITSCLDELEQYGLIKREDKKITWVKHPPREVKGNYTLVDIELIGYKINPTAKLIHFIMSSLKPDRAGYIRISHERLGVLLNMSTRRVQEPIKLLMEHGWITDVNKKKGYNTPNEYKVRRVDIGAVYAEINEDEEENDDDL